MTAHTPGPFVVHPLNAWIMCSQLDEEGEPTPVAALAHPTVYRSEAETRANGALFAAAPALLAAVERLLVVFEQQKMTAAERIIVGVSDAGLRTEGNAAIAALRAAATSARQGEKA